MSPGHPQTRYSRNITMGFEQKSDGTTGDEIRERMQGVYGEETLTAIEMVLRMIRMGNLMGNTFDYVLFKVSFGRLGQ
jgi:hypothetical protein